MKGLLTVFAISISLGAQSISQPLTKVEGCNRFRPAVVSIDVPPGPDGSSSAGTGFIVSSDGWVLTAAHVIIDRKTNQYFPIIEVVMDYANIERTAIPVTPIADALLHDVAALRIKDVPKRLPHLRAEVVPLEIAETEIQVGEDILMIGSPIREGISNQLCLPGTVAETFRGGPVLYQGVAVQGMSGGPMISLQTGKVIGIIDQRATDLTGLGKIGDQLAQAAAPAVNKQNEGDQVARLAIAQVVQILKDHMNNGLGVGVGASLVRLELENAKKRDQAQRP